MKEPIRKIELKDGTVRYRLVVDIGLDENGKRQQLTRTFDRLKEARAELSRIRHETDKGTFVKPSDITVGDYLEMIFQIPIWMSPIESERRAEVVKSLLGATAGPEPKGTTPAQPSYRCGFEYPTTGCRENGGPE